MRTSQPASLPSSAATSDTKARDQRKQYHVFVSHAGEQKAQLVDHVRDKFARDRPELKVFVDEWSLAPGTTAMDEVFGACEGAYVGEFIRSSFLGRLNVLLTVQPVAVLALTGQSAQFYTGC
jgi:hypothetical protein